MQLFNVLLNYTFTGNLAWLQDVYKTLPSILYAILAVVGGAGTVYSIILGINLAKSESEDKRKNAMLRLRNTIIGVVVLLVLVLFINLFLPMILNAAYDDQVLSPNEAKEQAKPAMIGLLNLVKIKFTP